MRTRKDLAVSLIKKTVGLKIRFGEDRVGGSYDKMNVFTGRGRYVSYRPARQERKPVKKYLARKIIHSSSAQLVPHFSNEVADMGSRLLKKEISTRV
ncbi:hypothetical protein NPIL_6611 [Nephila pilipes]|uniref:Uncharacterized protein n=1 Tax=Nephila pilipes TaxID=299642 RepID=A0A8X6Q428_NEPPI|nr:hypothetical protein NPIL_6611 [Nephila pilipes]